MEKEIFEKALHNIIDNSIKYSDENPKIIINCYDKDRNSVIEILDEGLQVNWIPSSSNDVAWVNIYRVLIQGERPLFLRELKPEVTQMLDVFVEEDQSYTYFLHAHDQVGNMGESSEMVTEIFTRDEEEKE